MVAHVNNTQITGVSQKLAVAILNTLHVEPKHMTIALNSTQHGHPGVCCCLTQNCRSELCNANRVLVLIAEADLPS